MKVALFKSMDHGGEYVSGESFESVKSYVRISEYVVVDFSPLQDSEVVQAQLDALDAVADEETEKYRRLMAGIDERRSKLMAITHQA